MKIHAYQEYYVNKVQSKLADVFDYAMNVCGISGNDFIKMFIVSSISKHIENGNPKYALGKSGVEILQDIMYEIKGEWLDVEVQERYTRSKEYWIGWAVAYYQWFSDRKFNEIFEVFSFEDLENMYYTLHEADITKFVDIVDKKMKEYFSEIKLKIFRKNAKLTQLELSKKSGVSLRSIQMYEQKNKDINKASAHTLYRFSKVFGCNVEDLIEK